MLDTGNLLHRLQGTDTGNVREAAFLAGDERVAEAVPLLTVLLADGNVGVQEAADAALRSIGGEKTVREVLPLLRSEQAPVRNLAMDILRDVGVQHLEPLLELMHDEDPDVRIFVSDILGSTGSVRSVEPLVRALLHDPEVNVRCQAAVSLGELGNEDAAPALGRAMRDEEWVQYAAVEALAKIGHGGAVDELLKAMDSCSELVLSMIVEALGTIGTPKAASRLLSRLNEFSDVLAHKAATAVVGILGAPSLGLLSAQGRETLRQGLLGALEDEEWDVREAAMQGLSVLGGEQASDSIVRIAAQLDEDTHPERLATAIDALASIGLTQALTEALAGKEQGLMLTAVSALARCRDSEVPTLLMRHFWEKPLDVQRAILAALYETAEWEARDFFLDVLHRHNDGKIYRWALRFLGEKLHDREAGEVLSSFLRHKYNDVKEAALEACIAVGGERMTQRFLRMCGDDDELQRMMGVFALGRLDAARHLDALEQSLRDVSPEVRRVALEAVAPQCRTKERVLRLVAGMLDDGQPEVRLTAVRLLGACDLPAVVPHLLRALEDGEDWVRIRAMEALGDMKVVEAVPRLTGLVSSPNRLLGIKAVNALGRVGDSLAFQALLDISGGEDQELADAAQAAIEAVQLHGEEQ